MPFTMTADEIPKMLADPAFQALPHERRTELAERAIAESGQIVAQEWDQPTFQKWGKFTEKVRNTVAGMEGVGEKISGAVSSTVAGVGHLAKALAQDAGTVALAGGEMLHPSGWQQGLPVTKALGAGFAAGVDSLKASTKSALTTNEQADLDVKAGLDTLKGEIDTGKVPMDDPAQFESWLTKHDTDLAGKRAKFFADADTILTRGLKVRDPNISETANAGANGLLHPDNAALLSSYMVTRSPETWKQLSQNLYLTPEMRAARQQGQDIREGPAGQAFVKAFGQGAESHLTSATHPLMLAGFALPALRGVKAATMTAEAGLAGASKAVGSQMLHAAPEMGAFGAVGQIEHDPQSTAGEIGTAAVQMAATGALLTGGIGAAGRGIGALRGSGEAGSRGAVEPAPEAPRAPDADPMEASFRRAMGMPEAEAAPAPRQQAAAFRDDPLAQPAPVGSGNVIADYGIAKTPEAQAQFDAAEMARQQQEAKLRSIEARAGSRMPVIPDSPLGGRDILDFVNDNPLHIPRKGSDAAGKAENNWAETYNVPLYYRKFLGSSERGHNATDLAQMAYDEHYIQEPTADALMAKIDEVIRARTTYKVEFRKREKAMEAEGKAVLNFERDQARGATQDKTMLALEDVNVGDEMTINGESAQVRKIEYDDDGYLTNVVIEDGKRYGVLSLDPATRAGVFVDEWAPKAREAVEADPFSQPPEVVAAEKVNAQERAAVAALDMGAKEQPGGFKNLKIEQDLQAGFMSTAGVDALVSLAHAAVKAGKDLAAWTAEMVARFGEAVRGYAMDAWDAAHARLGRTPREWQFAGNKGTMPSANEAGFLRPAFDELKELKDKFKAVPKFTPFKAALNGWVGRSQTNVLAVSKLMTELERRVPKLSDREGITNWIQAAGDDTLLAAREAASKGAVKAGYKAARNLSPEALAEAARISDFYERALQHAKTEGLDVKELDNYVNQVWKKPGAATRKQFAQFQTELTRSFKFAKHRKLESFFEGEQAGFEPATKDISKLMGLYLNELNKTISTRKLIGELTQTAAMDGKPLAVPRGGAVMTQEGAPGEVTLVLPGAQGSVKFEGTKYDVRDYGRLDHPALSAWKFVTGDSEGNPVMVLGELALHPEALKTMRNALGRSKIREFMESESDNVTSHLARKAVKALDVVQSQIKGMMMSLSPFHIVQEGTHAIGHKVNPFFNIPTIDPGNALHVDAMNHGLMLASERMGIDHFMDGLSGRGSWLEKVPGIGKAVRAMGDFTFHSYIPGLKMKTYDHILLRNRARFDAETKAGTMTESDVKYLSAKQTNAAYGHLNYKDMGRDPTIQHLLRMILLAPDFLEARAKFTGQAMQGITGKLGREQLAAMATLAITFFVSARIGNALANDGDMKMDHPFEFVVGNRVYSFRSVPEDIYRLFHRPQQFVAGRIAPVIGTGAMEGLYGVNYRGEKIDGMDAVQDVLTNAIPMSVRMVPGIRELVKTQKNHPVTPWEQFIGSIGVQIGRNSPITELQREAVKFAKASGVEDRGSYPISKYQQLRYALEDLNWDKAALEMQALVKEKNGRKGELRDGFKSSLFRHWTGTREMDAAWKSTMKPEMKEMLLHAEERRQLVWQRFMKMLVQ